VSRLDRRRKEAPAAESPRIEYLYTAPREHRDELKQALAAAIAGEPGPWRIRVSSKLVYLTPNAGTWWFKVRLTPPRGETFTALLDPDHLVPNIVRRAVAAARRKKLD
jgi:hypothetical protein